MDGGRTTLPPGEGLAHQAAATDGTAGAPLSRPLYHSAEGSTSALTPEQVQTLHRVYQFILSW